MERKSNVVSNAYVNPLYREKEEKEAPKGDLQSGEKNLNAIVVKKNKRRDLVTKFQSTKPRGAKSPRTTERKPEEVVLSPLVFEQPKLTKINPPRFAKTVPTATLSDVVPSPRGNVSLTKRRPGSEKRKSEKSLSVVNLDGESSSSSGGKVKNIELVEFCLAETVTETVTIPEEAKKPVADVLEHGNPATDKSEADEFVERSEEFPDEKQKQSKPKLAHRTRLLNVNPKTSNELAEAVKYLMEVNLSSEVGTVRAMKALYSAAGGHVPVDTNLPETRVYANKLGKVSNNERYEYLKPLFDQLALYLPPKERQDMRESLANLYSHTYMTQSVVLMEIELASIRARLEKQLSGL